MAPLPEIDYAQYNAVYNALSFGIAGMGAASLFVYWQTPNVIKKYRTALLINSLVTAIATYHYFRIFNSFADAYVVTEKNGSYAVAKSGAPFNDAYRYVDWLLTVPLLLIELILVMGLSADQTRKLSWQLGLASALMVCVGYPGEISDDQTTRWIFWGIAMLFFMYVLYNLLVGLAKAGSTEAELGSSDEEEGIAQQSGARNNQEVQKLIAAARILTAVSWLTYPIVYMVKSMGLKGAQAMTYEQVGYSIADVVAKAVFGILIWAIASSKSDLEEAESKRV